MNTLNDLHKISGSFSNTEKMPVLFLGHGSPMNAIEENQLRSWQKKYTCERVNCVRF